MADPTKQTAMECSQDSGTGLSLSRLEELAPRLEALLADFDHLETLESPDLEPLPDFLVSRHDGAGND